MPLMFEEVEDWTRKTDTLEALQDELSQRTTTLSGLQDQLSDIRRLDGWQGNTLNITPNTFPIGLDNSGFHTKAIVSVGNPDTADNVSVTVPGMGSQGQRRQDDRRHGARRRTTTVGSSDPARACRTGE